MENILIAQEALVPVLENTAAAVDNTPDETWTRGLVSSRLDLVDRYWNNFEQNHVALIQAGISPDHPYLTDGTYAMMEAVYVEARGRLLDAGARFHPEDGHFTFGNAPLANSTFAQPSRSSDRLPRIQIPEFSGRLEEWESFRDLFRSLIHNDSSLTNVDKLFYLKSYVKGEAHSALDNYQVTDANYAPAWQTLELRYDNKRLLAQDHIQALKSLKPMKEESAIGLRQLQDEIRRHRDRLRTLGRPVDGWDDWFVSCAAEAMDPKTRRAWETTLESRDNEVDGNQNQYPSFDTLIGFLGRRCRMIQALTKPQVLKPKNGPPQTHDSHDSRRVKVFATTSTAATICASCQGPHQVSRCPRFRQLSLKERKEVVSRARLCYNCLGNSHVVISCPSKSTCRVCGELHHTLLHNSADKRGGPPEDHEIPAKVPREMSLALPGGGEDASQS